MSAFLLLSLLLLRVIIFIRKASFLPLTLPDSLPLFIPTLTQTRVHTHTCEHAHTHTQLNL